MEAQERKTILDKLMKLFAMSKDDSSPHEAAIALGQAQKMMAKFGISKEEVGFTSYDSEKISVPLQVVKGPAPIILVKVCILISGVFGCRALTGSEKRVSDYSYYVEYFGRRQDVVIAGYTHAVVWKAMHKAWDMYKKSGGGSSGRGERMSFMVGWLEGVRQKVKMLKLDPEEEQMIEKKLKDKHPDVVNERSRDPNIKSGSAHAGYAASKDFSLHRPISNPTPDKLQ